MFIGGALHSNVSSFNGLKWNFFVCQSISCGLYKVNQDNPMMIMFVRDEITLKTTLLKCDSMIITNTLVYLLHQCFHTNSLLMKHRDAPKSNNVWLFIVMDFSHLIVINNRKQGVGFEICRDHFEHMNHWSLVSRSLLKLDVLISQFLKVWGGEGNDICCMLSLLL
jgi:hypothetical protein